MGKAIKVIQNGNSSILPYNQDVINRLESFNARLRPKDRPTEAYTIILDVTPEEEATIYPAKKQRKPVVNEIDRLAALEAENSQLKTMMLNFMAAHGFKPVQQELPKEEDAGQVTGDNIGESIQEMPELTKRGPGRPSTK